jgi:aryl-alcohol dehydrogenase-like predicted oxidoreductase
MKRRTFLRKTAGALTMLGMFPAGLSSINRVINPGTMEKRILGKSGLQLSIIGFGGIVVRDATPEQASDRVKEAIDYGVNFFDVAPSYGDAEVKLGPALKPYRKDIILANKTQMRDREGARMELERSLQRLETDYFDLYQFHVVSRPDEVEQIFGSGGAMETFLEAQKEGKIRHIGFSAHTVEAAMMLMDRFEFASIMFPFSASSWYAGNFGPQVMQRAHEKGLGILALKSMVKGPWPEGTTERLPKAWYEPMQEPDEARNGLRFALSHPITSAMPPGNENLFSLALKVMTDFTPLSPEETERIKIHASQQRPLFSHHG